jgi:hypothetical protein
MSQENDRTEATATDNAARGVRTPNFLIFVPSDSFSFFFLFFSSSLRYNNGEELA